MVHQMAKKTTKLPCWNKAFNDELPIQLSDTDLTIGQAFVYLISI